MGLSNKWQVQGEMTREQFELEMHKRLNALKEMIRSEGWKFMLDSLSSREDELIQAPPAGADDALARMGELRALRHLSSAPYTWVTQLETALKQPE